MMQAGTNIGGGGGAPAETAAVAAMHSPDGFLRVAN